MTEGAPHRLSVRSGARPTPATELRFAEMNSFSAQGAMPCRRRQKARKCHWATLQFDAPIRRSMLASCRIVIGITCVSLMVNSELNTNVKTSLNVRQSVRCIKRIVKPIKHFSGANLTRHQDGSLRPLSPAVGCRSGGLTQNSHSRTGAERKRQVGAAPTPLLSFPAPQSETPSGRLLCARFAMLAAHSGMTPELPLSWPLPDVQDTDTTSRSEVPTPPN